MSAPPAEPTLSTLSNPVKRYFLATRPPFLLATLAACALGLASTHHSGITLRPNLAIISLLLAMLVHATANVLNDYFDARNGTDAANTERLYPFTGGSRFIQNGILTPNQTAKFGYSLLTLSIAGGLWLVTQTGTGLVWIGFFGVLIGWAYSAEPLKLNSRGWGEICVFAGFLGLVIGTDFVQRQTFDLHPLYIGVPYALLVCNLLLINQFPDASADKASGKKHWVVRLPIAQAAMLYPLLASMALAWLCVMVLSYQLPVLALFSAFPLTFSLQAAKMLRQNATIPARLRPAIQMTLAAMLGHALVLTLILFWETS